MTELAMMALGRKQSATDLGEDTQNTPREAAGPLQCTQCGMPDEHCRCLDGPTQAESEELHAD